MTTVSPLIRPVIHDSDPHSEHAVWLLLEGVDGTFNDKGTHWLKDHFDMTNLYNELVVIILVTHE